MTNYWWNGIQTEPMIYEKGDGSCYVTFCGNRPRQHLGKPLNGPDGEPVMNGRKRRFLTLAGARRFCDKL